MTSGTKALLIILGLLTVVFILMQLTMGLLILNGRPLQKAHQHSGYVTVVLTLAYVALSLRVLLGIRARDAATTVTGLSSTFTPPASAMSQSPERSAWVAW